MNPNAHLVRCHREFCSATALRQNRSAIIADAPLHLQRQAESLASLSTRHLTPASRRKLAANQLSVPSYPNSYGGFVYVGTDWDNVTKESDLHAIFAVAIRAGFVWLKFDADAAVIDGLPVFDDAD